MKYKEFYINKYSAKNEVTNWTDNPVAYQSYSVCTTIDFSPKNTYHVIEKSALNDLQKFHESKEQEIKELCKTIEIMGLAISKGKERATERKNLFDSLEIQYKALLSRTIPYLQQFNVLSHIEEQSINDLLVDIDEVLND